MLLATEPQAYLSALVNEIIKNNPASVNDVRIFFSRSFYANASSMGEGTILFNIGLFHRLQNEAQAAFVLCHELAHYYLNHINNNIYEYVATVNSDDFQKQLKNIQKSGYGQNSQLEIMAKNLIFRNRRHSRAFEQAADSLALELLKNTGYDVQEALSCLSLLDSADKDKYDNDLELEKRFHFSSFPFKKGWLHSDDLQFTVPTREKDTKEKDSLKTHPDCALRIARLTNNVKQYRKQPARNFIVSEQSFHSLKKRFDYETIQYCFDADMVSRALYFTLQMLPHHPDDAYLNTMVGQCLNKLYTAQKAHQLGKITDLPNMTFTDRYNGLTQMIQNLRLQELAALSYYFLKEKETLLASYEPFIQAYTISKQHFIP